MKIGVYINTHGITSLRDGAMRLVKVDLDDMEPLRVAQRAEELGYHSLWFSDHVTMTRETESLHNAADPIKGTRAYPPSPNMLDALVMMGAVLATTERIAVAPSILVSPYRHPLSDSRQLLTLEAIAPGRLILAVGTGWLKEEFDALGVDYKTRSSRTVECIEIYKRALGDEPCSYDGQYFSFPEVSMEPRPAVRPDILFGGVTRRSAEISATHCEGWFPTFTDPAATVDRYDDLLDHLAGRLRDEGGARERFHLAAVVSARVLPEGRSGPDRLAEGGLDKVLSDLRELHDRGFQNIVLQLNCESESMDEYWEQLDLFGTQVIPEVSAWENDSGWGEGV